MEIRWLQAFIAVAEELHFGRAATRLQMAQSPLSQTIRKLERDLGVELFERNTRSVALTAAGRAFLPHARAVLSEVERARQATKESVGAIYGRITLGFTGVLNHLSLPPLTRAVRDTYPDIELDLVGRVMTRDAVEQLDSGSLDIAFVGLPVDAAHIRTRLIASEPFGIVVPSDHRLADAGVVDLADLADEEFVSTPRTSGSALRESADRACLDAGFRPRITQEITDPYMILMLVAAGVGVALMTEGIADVIPPGATYIRLPGGSVRMDHGIAWSAKPVRSSVARDAVLDLAEQILPTPHDDDVTTRSAPTE
ncbi:LysR family transcriptional regulator [Gordonia desulfuricans]|uniref:LysR family transcriptional regulator n=1 Tax=Gordonia desulfuricans TaxID=89051 RepID=A0A7K3LPX3_9ACTN|nr:LysR family transcriptional regulator [Gordonia desulfuricans]NDK90283.1 LysR family transcriptional regulator [Gordonia desulfuricans]